jgi:uncharacterized membrane protein HdeD (DUF308 family)
MVRAVHGRRGRDGVARGEHIMFDPLQSRRGRTLFGTVDLDDVREHRGRFVAVGIALVILGALAIFLPFAAGVVTTLLLGWLLIVGGIAELVHGVVDRRWGGSGWEIASALLYLVAGVLTVAFPLRAKLFLMLVLSVFLVADGIVKLARAYQHRDVPGGGWLLFDGIASVVLGIMLWRHWPSTAAWALGLLVGISLVLDGTSMLVIGLGAGRAAQARP